MNRICSAYNTKIDINNYEKDRTVCKNRYNKNIGENKSTVSYQQSKIENGNINNNNRTLLVGPSFSEKNI